MFVLWVAGIQGVGEQHGKCVTALVLLPKVLLKPLALAQLALLSWFSSPVLPSVE